ncbi:MAG: HAD family hydrolase [Bacteroidales bacterium]|nr:HAD family hydrolase [Bacteroidales bacterium]
MLQGVKVLAFDADDTLWSNEPLFREAERKVAEALSAFGDFDYISDELYKVEFKNMEDYGFGAKAYTLSMIENAVNLSGGKLTGEQIMLIIESGRNILHNPATPLPGVEKTLSALKEDGRYRLALLTKGELHDQERKINRSGLGKYFSHTDIVSKKSKEEYITLCAEMGIEPGELLMVGNSFKSDIEPVLQLGGWGIHIPAELLWKLEHTEEYDHQRLFKVKTFEEIIDILL